MFIVNDSKRPFYKVYLLDDDQCTLDLVEAMLDADPDNFYEVLKFTSSPEALKAIFLEPPDFLILDVNLPIINGFEICQKVKANCNLSDITIILMTAYHSKYAWYDGLLLYRADSYLPKPFSCETFIKHIHDIISLKQRHLPGHTNTIIAKVI